MLPEPAAADVENRNLSVETPQAAVVARRSERDPLNPGSVAWENQFEQLWLHRHES
jgi:hypothetical protein